MKRIRSLRSLFLGRTHTKPVRTIVVAQRIRARRVEAQTATTRRVDRNRRPIAAVAANAYQLAFGIAAKPRRREEDGLCFCGISVKIPTLQGAVPNSVDFRKRICIVSSRCKSRKSITGRKFEADGAGVIDRFYNRIVVSSSYIIINTP